MVLVTNATIVVVENIKIVTAIKAAVAKIAQEGNIKTKIAKLDVKIAQAGNIKTKVAKVDVKIAPQAFTKIMGAVQFAKFVRKVNIKTRMVKHIVTVVFRGNTTPKREQLHLLRAKIVRKVSGKTCIASQIVKVV